jgi:hypothetical protein
LEVKELVDKYFSENMKKVLDKSYASRIIVGNNHSGVNVFYELITKEENNPAVYRKLLPLPIEILAKAALKVRFPNAKLDNVIDLIKLLPKTEAQRLEIKGDRLIPQWYKDKWLK